MKYKNTWNGFQKCIVDVLLLKSDRTLRSLHVISLFLKITVLLFKGGLQAGRWKCQSLLKLFYSLKRGDRAYLKSIIFGTPTPF